MVPATMLRKAMVAVLCAVVATLIPGAVLAQGARADTVTDTAPIAASATWTESTDPTWFEDASAEDWTWSDWFTPDSESSSATAAASTDPSVATDPAPADASTVTTADAATSSDPTLTANASTLTATTDSLTTTSTLTTDTLAAPTMSVSGQTVSWTPTQGVTSYVFATKVPGQATQYSIVNGTSITPPAVPGTTVSYGVRTNVTGSYWAQEVSITYPSTTTTTTSTSPTPVDGTFQMGLVAGSALSYELSFIHALGAHTARLELGIGTSASNMASVIDAYARAGIRPLLLASFYGRTPTTAESQNLASWAAAYGPGGTFWIGKTYPANTAVTDIEFGNETSYSYQFSDNSTSTYATRAQTYALQARTAAAAIAAANARVGLLVQGDNAQQGTAWVTNMFKAVPDLGNRVAGWTIHPYGPSWATRIDSTVNSTASMGSPVKPIWVTEWGLSSDNGRCLDDNYGFNKCMTYAEAATTLHSALSGMLTRYGSQLGAFFLYQAHDQYATGTSTSREAYFGAEQSNGTAKGAYTTEVTGDLAVN